MKDLNFKAIVVCFVIGWLGGWMASPASAVTILWQAPNAEIHLGLPFSDLEFENPLSGGEMVKQYSVLEWRDADYAAGNPRFYDDWTVNDPTGIDGNANEIWMRRRGHSIATVTTVASTVISIHMVGDHNDGLAEVLVDGQPVAKLDMYTLGPGGSRTETALIIAKNLTNRTHSIVINDLGQSPSGPTGADDVATLGAAALGKKIKWVQRPEPALPDNLYYGWNEPSIYGRQLVADDWACKTEDPITAIHWWGSFKDWKKPEPPQIPQSFHITIWDDVPDPSRDDPGTFSHPGRVVWEIDCNNFSYEFVGWDYDPRTGCYEACFRFDQLLREDDYFYQKKDPSGIEPTIYWISIAAKYPGGTIVVHPWGWKMRPRVFNDDAVRIFKPTDPHVGNQYEDGEPIYWPDPNNSWDMAFELTARPVMQDVKYAQKPEPGPEGFFGWDEPSVYGWQQVVADDWPCYDPRPISDVHWWGSHRGWTEPVPPPDAPVGFNITIWTNVPAGVDERFSHPGQVIWQWKVDSSQLQVIFEGFDDYPGHPRDSCFHYSFDVPKDQWFYQEPGGGETIYWICISAIYDQEPHHPWGWKTRPKIFMDDAIRILNPTSPVMGSKYVTGQPIEQWDMAFVLTTVMLGEPYVKWSQPPEPYVPPTYTGWNELSVYGWSQITADDWLCTTDDPVADIHWWGSFKGWSCEEPPLIPESFHIAIWTDVPAGVEPWSHPGKVIWETDSNDFTWEFAGWDIDPCGPVAPPEACFKFELDIPEEKWFYQKPGVTHPSIYWLSIAAKYPADVVVEYPWGWKTLPRNPESPAPDDAVRIFDPTAPVAGSQFVDGQPIWWPTVDRSWDLAFVLTTKEKPPVPKPKAEHLKWSQPPIERNPDPCNLEPPSYCGWDEASWYQYSDIIPLCPREVADDFRCLGTMPITSIHWWGSYLQWDAPEPPPLQPIAWRFRFYSNIPADPDGDPNFSLPGRRLWQVQVDANRVHSELAGRDEFPMLPPDACFQYYVDLKPDEYFWQANFEPNTVDDIFWLSIQAIYPKNVEVVHPWGWKTRPWSWMDDAVGKQWRVVGWEPGPGGGTPILACVWWPVQALGESFDTAFELDTHPDYIKWEQPYTGIRDWPHYEDEKSMAVVDTQHVTKWNQPPDTTEAGVDVDATLDLQGWLPQQLLADDFKCEVSGSITDIHIYGSWWRDQVPGHPGNVTFTLSFHEDLPVGDPRNPQNYSMPGKVLWQRQFRPGDFKVQQVEQIPESYYIPCSNIYTQFDHQRVWKYSFHIDKKPFVQQEGTIYWLDVQAQPQAPNPEVRFGWKTSLQHWNDDAVFVVAKEPYNGTGWRKLTYPTQHPFAGQTIDLAFELETGFEQFHLLRRVADDWKCRRKTPVTSIVWWGSYLSYYYQPCEPSQVVPPVRPDYFLLTIWDDVPPNPGDPCSFSHPNDIIWEYKAEDYDEVLVGYDKYPLSGPQEPVFRYSVKLPAEARFCQEDVNHIYWLSVVAVYDQNDPSYPWGWTNHKCTAWEPEGLNELAHWKLDETSGLLASDSSGNGNYGSLMGGPTWQPGKICGGALQFGDVNDYVAIANESNFDLTDEITVSAWVNINTVPRDWTTIVAKGDSAWRLSTVRSEKRFHFGVTGPPDFESVDGSTVVPAGEWHHVCGTFDGSVIRLYVDGVEDANKAYSGSISTNDYKVFIGGNAEKPAEGYRSWDGLLDDVRIYDRALSAAEVRALAKMGRNDDAVAWERVLSDLVQADDEWKWRPLTDQTGRTEDMSFILFTDPNVGCWCYDCFACGDSNGDCLITSTDVLAVINAWPPKPYHPCADYNKDGLITSSDVLVLVNHWPPNAACPASEGCSPCTPVGP